MYGLVLIAVLSILTTSCATRLVRASNAPAPAVQLKLAALSRVWVAGFVTEKRSEFDLNAETIRLLRLQLRTWSSAQVVETEPLAFDSEQRFTDIPYWRRLGEEHGQPLIITGSVRLHLAPARVVHRGVRTVYVYATGRVLEATVVLIDGRTGKILSSDKLPTRMRYGVGRFSSGPSLFLQMMESGMDDWFGVISRGVSPSPS